MNTIHKQFQEMLNELETLTIAEKIRFLESLFFQFTIAGRAIWSDDQPTDHEKVEALKWLNELTHKTWNIHFTLRQGENESSIFRLYENMQYYAGQSKLLGSHLIPTTLGAFERFKQTPNTL